MEKEAEEDEDEDEDSYLDGDDMVCLIPSSAAYGPPCRDEDTPPAATSCEGGLGARERTETAVEAGAAVDVGDIDRRIQALQSFLDKTRYVMHWFDMLMSECVYALLCL